MARKIPDTGRFRVFTRNSDFHGKALKWMNPASAWPSLRESGANVVHVSPEHHYPLGTVTTAGAAPGAAFLGGRGRGPLYHRG